MTNQPDHSEEPTRPSGNPPVIGPDSATRPAVNPPVSDTSRTEGILGTSRWKIGDRIQDRWEISDIKYGGMGIVYIVGGRLTGEYRPAFAAKTFRDDIFAQDPTIANRFTREALAWVKLGAHPNIVPARFVEDIGGKPFVFAEYVDGSDLSEWIRTGRLRGELPRMVEFAIQFCDGMIYARSKGLKAHRDIKPQNCLITKNGILKLTDFGLAKLFDDTNFGNVPWPESTAECLSLGVTRAGVAAGTPPYMAPEQFDDGKQLDERTDIYSFGVLLFEMITGRLPFDDQELPEFEGLQTDRRSGWRHFEYLHKTLPPPALQSSEPALDTLVHCCLAKDPSKRFQNFNILRQRLAEVHRLLEERSMTDQGVPNSQLALEQEAAGWPNKAASLMKLGLTREALTICERAVKFNPLTAEGWLAKGDVLIVFGRFDLAMESYQAAQRLGHANVEQRIALCRQRSGTTPEEA